MKRTLFVAPDVVERTILSLKDAGNNNSERLLLWIGATKGFSSSVSAVLVPDQIAGKNIFRVPPSSMTKIVAILKEQRKMIVAQVHSHPGEAFHSQADDKLAIISRVGALSVVVPYFATGIDHANFFDYAKLFVLSHQNIWTENSIRISEEGIYEY